MPCSCLEVGQAGEDVGVYVRSIRKKCCVPVDDVISDSVPTI